MKKADTSTKVKKKKKSRFVDTFARVFDTMPAKIGGILLVIIVFLCVLAPVFAGYDPNELDMSNVLAKPSLKHLCGTDNLGRDQWARILYGGRYSLALGIIGSLFAAVGGTGLGVIAGYFGGQVENLIMRFCDIWSAIPGTLLCIVISTALGSGFFNTILALSIGAVPNGARMTRGQILAERTKEYLEAAEAMNCSKLSIMFRHLLPNVISPTIVGTTMGIGATITQAATLSYIGLGVQAMNPIIRSDGSPGFAMISTVAGAVFNIIFDPICIYGLKWGMMGAAVATIGGQIPTAILAIWYLFRMKSVKLERESFGLNGGLMAQFLPLGITSLLSQISVVASMAAVNNMIVKYGALDAIYGQAQYAQIPMAVLGIVMKFFQIVISISVGLAAGCIPIVGYNVGAKRNDRVLELFKRLLLCEFIVGFVAMLIVEILPVQLISVFGAANECSYYTEFGIRAFRTYLCLMPLATVNKGTFIYLQSLGKAMASSGLSMVREILFGVGLALILPIYFGLNGVLYSMPLADGLTFLIAAVLILNIMKQLHTPG